MKKRKHGISIIVPVYNVKGYLNDCVDSLLNQKFKEYEILLIDDGSTDGSSQVCDEQANLHKDKVRVFHKKNGGLGDARNYGVKQANYDYICFIDSDDWVSSDMLEKLGTYIEHDYDVISYDVIAINDGEKRGTYRPVYEGNPESSVVSDYVLNSTEPAFATTRLMKIELVEKTPFPVENLWYEDVATIPIILSNADSIFHVQEAFYYYRQRNNSITSILVKNPKTLGIVKAWERILKEGNKKYIEELEYAIYYSINQFLTFRPEYADEFMEYIKKNESRFQQNSYIQKAIDSKKLRNLMKMQLIPKKIHYFWFGGNPLSELSKRCIESWKKYAPEFEIIEWNESNCDINCNDYVKEAYQAKKWAFVADYFRTKVLYEQGGFYMDTDMELRDRIDIFRVNKMFFPQETTNINSCIFGTISGQPLLKEWRDSYENDHFIKEDGSYDTTTIVVRLTKYLEKKYKLNYDCNDHLLNDEIMIYGPDVLLVDTFNGRNYAIHHYDASWWNVKRGKESYQYYVLQYFFSHNIAPKQSLIYRIKHVIYEGGRKTLKTLLPNSFYHKTRKLYRKVRPR